MNLLKLVEAQPQGLDHAPHDWADVLSGGARHATSAILIADKDSYALLLFLLAFFSHFKFLLCSEIYTSTKAVETAS